jgi:hypothetical protein
MRTHEEIQRAHDTLVGVILREVPVQMKDRETQLGLHAALDALCWVLQDRCESDFADNLSKIEKELAARGFRLERRTS